jgi:hypothetical protein
VGIAEIIYLKKPPCYTFVSKKQFVNHAQPHETDKKLFKNMLDFMQEFSQYYALFISVFGIRDILGRIWVLGFVHLLTDPALFISGFQDPN